MKKLGKFFAAMFSEWGSGLSGPASVPLAILALNVSTTRFKVIYGVSAVVLGFISAYRIWLKQYERAEHELALNTRPEINLEVLHCFWGYPTGYNSGPSQTYVWLRLTNLRDVNTIAKAFKLIVRLDGRTVDGPNDVTFRGGQLRYERDIVISGATLAPNGRAILDMFPLSFAIRPEMPLTRGIHKDGWLAFNVDLDPINRWQSPPAIVTVEVTDSFDGKHQSKATNLDIHYVHEIHMQQ